MASITLSHSLSPTARLFLLSSFLDPAISYTIISDKKEDKDLIEKFGPRFLSRKIRVIDSLEKIWSLDDRGYVYIVHPSLLETVGNIDYLKRQTSLTLRRSETLTIDEFIDELLGLGYVHKNHLEDSGTYKKEGSVITVTHPFENVIIQLEYFDTEIDSIIITDRSSTTRKYVDTITIPARKYQGELGRQEGNLNMDILSLLEGPRILIGCDFLLYLDMLRSDACVHFTDFHREASLPLDIAPLRIAHIDELTAFLRENISHANIRIYTRYPKPIEEFLSFHTFSDIRIIETQKISLESVVMPREAISIVSDLGKMCTKTISDEETIENSNVSISGGTSSPRNTHTEGKDLVIISDDILSPIFVRSRSEKNIAKHLDLLLQIRVGDYVVHRDHGIGKFEATIMKELSGVRREYLELHYAQGDKLFVPLTEIYRVSKYVGELEPTLTRLEGKEWERILEKTDEELELIANELLEIGAKRTLAKGISFGRFEEEVIFRNAFSYVHTPDQLSAIEEVSRDMESENPMDRLLSGDVGFGKTEVAMNALYKAVLSGYQAAVISPLLVLADEHYETFIDRLGNFGVKIACMTRMTTPKEEREILSGLRKGTIDIVVGTHRLLSEDIRFAKLGLLVIDEEHKFGVTHKERFKKMRSNVDILSLSATPIPRSLNLALSGLKKISILTTPPAKKKPIETIVSRWNEATIAHAIDYEYERGGQIIIVHNRIGSLEQVEREIRETLQIFRKGKRAINIVTTHGRLTGDLIEDRIHAFKKREYDILLTTTIIENGVNFLSANTIVILDPEQFGLAQLHQLRGRVGRKDEQGYCYLIYRKPELATEEKERIVTIANHNHLGAGFEIAMRDMEIRGAGEVLGLRQAGRSKEVGLSLYFRLLEEKIETIRNERKSRGNLKIELDLSYAIRDEFFAGELDKLTFFRDLESIETLEEIESSYLRFKKQFDTLSEEVENLFLLLRARIVLADYGVLSLKKSGMHYVFDFASDTKVEKMKGFLERFDPKKQMALLSLTKVRVESRYYRDAKEFLETLL